MIAALATLTWRVTDAGVVADTGADVIAGAGLISDFTSYIIYGLLLALIGYQSWKLSQVNKDMPCGDFRCRTICHLDASAIF